MSAPLDNKAPIKGKRNILITSALPYVNNVPHLGNLIGCILSADVYSRYCKLRGYNSLFVCGTDEYGTATETKAIKENTTPQEICDKYHAIHKEVYDWFDVECDHFGRTTTAKQTEIAQDIFLHCMEKGYLVEDEMEQLFCNTCQRYLADRLVRGTCPFCKFEDSRGDQCDAPSCGKLLNAIELLNPRCEVCSNTPVVQKTRHLFLDLPKVTPQLEEWFKSSVASGKWSSNCIAVTESWLRDGLKPRCITRDLKWGTPVPHPGYENKVFYVWFDAPIGYISISANYTDDWEKWWKPADKDVEFVQFMGKDNVPFHSVIFPSSLLSTGQDWNLVGSISATEYLTYEGGKFSKTRGIGVFGDQAKDTGISSDTWRYYLLASRPEQQDADFTWADLQSRNNGELADNIGNLVARSLKFAYNTFDKHVPGPAQPLQDIDNELIAGITNDIQAYCDALENLKLRDGLKIAMAASTRVNVYIQANKPWEMAKDDRKHGRCTVIINLACSVLVVLLHLFSPYMPTLAKRIAHQLNVPITQIPKTVELLPANHALNEPEILIKKLDDKRIDELRAKFAGGQKVKTSEKFELDLRIAEIAEVKNHPDADKLYLLTVDLGTEKRQVVAGVKDFFTPEQLLNKRVLMVCNLEPIELKGQKSEGMLLTAIKSKKYSFLSIKENNAPGTQIVPEGMTLEIAPNFNGKLVKSQPFKVNKLGVFIKDAKLGTVDGKESIVLTEEGTWEGAKIQ